jgi:dTDP-4-dehydrorhamnose reductase
MKVLIFGVTGMLGNSIFRLLSNDPKFITYGTARNNAGNSYFDDALLENILFNIDVENQDALVSAFEQVRPDVVINCVGLVKQASDVDDPLQAIPINSLLPHRLAALCEIFNSRLIHFSTDCVFSGSKGNYSEIDFPDATDLYGRTKLLGEVDYPHAITLRTSIIGHEIIGNKSLIGWFLSQSNSVRGYRQAIFSGLPTVEVGLVIRDYVIPRPDLRGVYHLSANPISKYDLLCKVAKVYGKDIEINPYDDFIIDRSLDSSRFQFVTGYSAPDWMYLIQEMYKFR